MRLSKRVLSLSFLLIMVFCPITVFSQGISNKGFFSEQPVFRMAFPDLPVEWHPHRYYNSYEAQLFTAIYEGLVTNHPITQRPIPAVAQSWTISSDNKTYTFKIRTDARFWNGDRVTADDFVNSWLSMLALGQNAPFSTLLEPIQGVKAYRANPSIGFDAIGLEALDPETLQVRLENPASYFLQILCHQSMVPIHPSNLNPEPWDGETEIIGNGPFRFITRTPQSVILAKNLEYWDKNETFISQIEIDFLDDPSLVTAKFNSHYYQWVLSDVDFQSITKRSTIIVTPQFSTNFLFFNHRIPVFQDARVRRALGLLTNLDAIRDPDVYFIPANRLVPEIPFYPAIQLFPKTNKTEALSLLASAGYPNGRGLPPIIFRLPEGESSERIVGIFKEAWKDLDITVEFQAWKGNDYNERLQSADYTIGSLGWIGDYADPLTFLDLFGAQSNLNVGRFQDPAFERLISESQLLSGAARYRSLAKAEEYLIQNFAAIPLSHNPAINIIDLDQVEGWYENPFDLHPFKTIRPKAAIPPRNIASL